MKPHTDEAGTIWYPASMWEALVRQSIEVGGMHQRAIIAQNELGRQLKEAQVRLAEAERRAETAERDRNMMLGQVKALHQQLSNL